MFPSRTLAAIALQQLSNEKVAAGVETWERPEVLSVSGWLTSCWHAARLSRFDIPALLSASQERELWQSLFEELHPELFDPAGAARLAMKAAGAIAEWQVPLEGEAWERSKDSESFQALFRRFEKELRERGCITRAKVWHMLPEWIRSGMYRPENISFVGFKELSPSLTRMGEALGDQAKYVPFVRRETKSRHALHQCLTFEQEVETAARWARRLLESEPRQSIGIFVPNLPARHALVERVFNHVFDPGGSISLQPKIESQQGHSPAIFHAHSAPPLLREPLITGALTLLELLRPRVRISDASAILLSPFVKGAAKERGARALADLGLRRGREIDVTLNQMEYRTVGCEVLASVWQRVRATKLNATHLDFSGWSELFGDVVSATGWPGDEALSKHEQAAAESWNRALLDLASLGFVAQPVTLDTALSRLRDSLLHSSGVENGDLVAPIQIMDLLAADGVTFDQAAALGLSEEYWPTAARLVPFVPPQLQRWAKITENESQEKAAVVFASSSGTLLTYSGKLAAQVKSFLKGKPSSAALWDGGTALGSRQPEATGVDCLEDVQAPPFRLNEAISGGVGVIKAQAACPFRAFAEYRLVAQRPEDACFGFDARERGGYLHRALENVWKRLQTFDALQRATDVELEHIVNAAVAEALTSQKSSSFRDVITLAEQERLRDAILYWLCEKEKKRGTPFRAEHLEEKKTVAIGDLQLRIRVDRIDRLDDGSVVLLDYKSGEIAERDLLGERPKEPQLLVYAAAMEENVDGIFLAQVRPREAKTAGGSLRLHFPPSKNSKLDWADLKDQSRVYLNQLASEFTTGFAAVHPRHGACSFCNLPPLCRIGEEARSDGDEESD